ncbi:uncharacterized protein GGS25DRAFT_498510 [Hypoxylon fragiforme]|uniref:uncharacterized protein n=1 Tax=Hypoxylon fragiforme TaxID=63214 RepID=UPI0020C65E69|nr:uncharacterized protein GGS25DRAFT_498510 [Hypoxylon fragiforme]KAI2605897.1 hypothetical protein GGS25DRAFT_498510 [Hypoxylon fragiforme]
MSTLSQITTLHLQISSLLDPRSGHPTRSSLHSALSLADAAVDLACEARVAASAVRTCESVQQTCLVLLAHAYAGMDDRERSVYAKSASTRRGKRGGRVFGLDAGEHVVEALQALNLERLLESGEEDSESRSESSSGSGSGSDDDGAAISRRIRWMDEVANAPIRTVHYLDN